ncbi:MAG: PAS domain S-box protein, partial [Betaproteobacteria bacterium]|nr:PAS domain S-box protein [Betaproteobacteria bacterium]
PLLLHEHLVDQEWFNALLDSSLDCIIAIDHDGIIVEYNHAAEVVFGYSATEAIGQRLDELIIPGRYRNLHRAALAHYLQTGKGNIIGRRVEVNAQTKSGREIPVELTVLPIHPGRSPYFTAYLRDITERKAAEEKIRQYSIKLKESLIETINSVSATVELRDPYTAGHQRRVAALAYAIGRELKLDEQRLEGIYFGGMVHDIGKIVVPTEVLADRGHLGFDAWKTIHLHPAMGYKILKSVHFPWPIATMILQHHEKLDGSGYPNGLMGDDIILESRIITVADVVEAIHSARPYRDAKGIAAALDEITRWSGIKYDAGVVATCRRLIVEQGFDINDNDYTSTDFVDLAFMKVEKALAEPTPRYTHM